MKKYLYIGVGVAVIALLVMLPRIFPVFDTKALLIEAVMVSQNAKSLDFYGKIVDQNGDPVAGVKVTAKVGLIVSFTQSGGYDATTLSDANGLFKFVGLHGSGTGFLLGKDGYEFNARLAVSGRPQDYVPDPNHPVIFPIWKLKGAEPMYHWIIDASMPYDGQKASFDLSKGRITQNGDFKVTLSRNPVEIRRGGPPFDWNASISVDGGGLIETEDAYQNLAPDTGYQPILQFSDTKDDPHWTRSLTKTFYVHLSNGSYGKVSIDLATDSNIPERNLGVGIGIESWINPSGSRNLEFDPAKQINP